MKFKYRPQPIMNGKKGKCRFVVGHPIVLGQDVVKIKCGKEFVGPPSRRYCDEHSRSVKFRGKG
jgi:hypothetical protein